MTWSIILLILGMAILIKSADWLVDGASSIAKKMGIKPIVIGLTIVAFGTSAPELVVNIMASVKGSADIAIGNIIGSNIANILLILGIAAIIYPLAVKRDTVWKEIPLAFLAMWVVALLANDVLIERAGWSGLTRIDGFILIAFFLIFLYYTFEISKGAKNENNNIKTYPGTTATLMIVGGMIGLTWGGFWVIDGAIAIAKYFNLSEALIGLTIVAVGTSLPELVTSAMAAYKHNADIAIGNIVGSNIFNIFWILGLSAILRPLPFSAALNTDLLIGIIATIMLFMFMFVGKKHTLERWQGYLFVGTYLIYIIYLIYRG